MYTYADEFSLCMPFSMPSGKYDSFCVQINDKVKVIVHLDKGRYPIEFLAFISKLSASQNPDHRYDNYQWV